jgi:hypothetical protein
MLATSVLGDWPCSVPVSRLVGFGKEIEVYDYTFTRIGHAIGNGSTHFGLTQ